jgi:hypothetical protein
MRPEAALAGTYHSQPPPLPNTVAAMFSSHSPRPQVRREILQAALVLAVLLFLDLLAWLPNGTP